MEALAQLGNANGESIENAIEPQTGWIDIDRSKISYGGMLYPQSYRFQVKTVNVGTIKYFSTLDENNVLSVNDALTFVIDKHIRVLDGNRALKSLDVIYEHDRFFFVMLVHTFSGAPTALTYETKCTHEKCNCVQEVSITPYNLSWKEIPEKGQTYINPKTGAFVIPSKNLGTLNYRPLTLSESGELTEFMLSSRRNGEDIEKFFLQAAPFIVSSAAKKDAASVYQEYLQISNDSKKVSLFLHILKEIIVFGQLLEIEVTCKKCSRPFRAQISSVKGLGNIFLTNDIADELS